MQRKSETIRVLANNTTDRQMHTPTPPPTGMCMVPIQERVGVAGCFVSIIVAEFCVADSCTSQVPPCRPPWRLPTEAYPSVLQYRSVSTSFIPQFSPPQQSHALPSTLLVTWHTS